MKKKLVFVCLFFFFPLLVFATEVEEGNFGRLIITYQTGSKGERLDRVRIRLTDDQYNQQIWPKGNNFVQDDQIPSRMVVIDNLPVGRYQLEFLIPNRDGLFDYVIPHHIEIKKGEVARYDQVLRLNVLNEIHEIFSLRRNFVRIEPPFLSFRRAKM